MSSFRLFKGTHKVGLTTANLDVSSEIYQARINVVRSAVTVPETGSQDSYDIGGSLKKELVISYMTTSNTGASASVCSQIFFDAVVGNDTVEFSTTAHPGAVSPSNPRYVMTLAPMEASRGGTQGDIGRTDVTYSIIGDITKETS